MSLPNKIILMMQAITGDSIVLKFEKARCSLEDSLRRVNDIVPQAIGSEVIVILVWWLSFSQCP